MNGNAFGNETIKLVIPDKPFALIFDLFSFLQDNINWTRRLLRRTLRLQVTKHTQGGKMRVGVVYAAVQDGYLVFPLNVVQRCFRGYLVTNTS